MATPAGDDFRQKTEGARESLKTLVDEIRVQMHLAGMDAQEAWKDLEPQLRQLESRLNDASFKLQQASDEAELQAHLAAREAKDRWEVLQESVSDIVESVVDRVVDKSRAPKRVVDRSKVQAHLARLEAEDKVTQAAEALKGRLEQSRSEVLHEAARFVDGLTTALSSLHERLYKDKRKD